MDEDRRQDNVEAEHFIDSVLFKNQKPEYSKENADLKSEVLFFERTNSETKLLSPSFHLNANVKGNQFIIEDDQVNQ